MKITIVRPDNIIHVDGVARAVDCSSLPAYVSVIQWQDDAGWIEFINDGHGAFLPNLKIADFAPYEYLAAAWRAAGEPVA